MGQLVSLIILVATIVLPVGICIGILVNSKYVSLHKSATNNSPQPEVRIRLLNKVTCGCYISGNDALGVGRDFKLVLAQEGAVMSELNREVAEGIIRSQKWDSSVAPIPVEIIILGSLTWTDRGEQRIISVRFTFYHPNGDILGYFNDSITGSFDQLYSNIYASMHDAVKAINQALTKSIQSECIVRLQDLDPRELETKVSVAITNALNMQRDISNMEVELATRYPNTSVDGRAARGLAVYAAVQGKLDDYAEELVKKYSAEENAPEDLVAHLKALLNT